MRHALEGHCAVGAESGLCCNESVLTNRESDGAFPSKAKTVDSVSVAFHRRALSVFGAALFGAL